MMREEGSLGKLEGGVMGVFSIDMFEWAGAQITLGG
jgi:hypothetical protein